MEKQRKIRCDCGAILQKKEIDIDKVITEAMVCPKCHFTTLTKDQAKAYAKRKDLQDTMRSERKIIRIGNSMGITLPDAFHKLGAKVGMKVSMEAIDDKSIKIQVMN